VAFFMAFHIEIDGFRSLARSLLTLPGAMLYDYDIGAIQKQNWFLGPLLNDDLADCVGSTNRRAATRSCSWMILQDNID
jgi:hypothetical protein